MQTADEQLEEYINKIDDLATKLNEFLKDSEWVSNNQNNPKNHNEGKREMAHWVLNYLKKNFK